MIDRIRDRHAAGHRHQAPGRLEAEHAAPGRRGADRPALVTAERHGHFASSHQRRTAAGRAAGRVFRVVRIANGTGRAGVAAGRETKIFARRLAGDYPAGVEYAGDDRGVDFGNVAFEYARAVHHRHAGDTDVVFDRDPLARQDPALGADDVRLPVPGVVRVLLGRRPIARLARIFYRQLRLGQLIKAGIRSDRARHQSAKRGGVLFGQVHAERPGDLQNLRDCRQARRNGHFSAPLACLSRPSIAAARLICGPHSLRRQSLWRDRVDHVFDLGWKAIAVDPETRILI